MTNKDTLHQWSEILSSDEELKDLKEKLAVYMSIDQTIWDLVGIDSSLGVEETEHIQDIIIEVFGVSIDSLHTADEFEKEVIEILIQLRAEMRDEFTNLRGRA